jgi:hypothetical protein
MNLLACMVPIILMFMIGSSLYQMHNLKEGVKGNFKGWKYKKIQTSFKT